MITEEVKVVRTDTGDRDFISLVRLLDIELAKRDGEEHSFFAQFNKLGEKDFAVVAFAGEKPVGCGALRSYCDGVFEIKRMFVCDEVRGKRIGSQILKTLETWALELGGTACLLETGIRQPEAIRLYERESYQRIPNYGQYAKVKTSVCMKKDLENGKSKSG